MWRDYCKSWHRRGWKRRKRRDEDKGSPDSDLTLEEEGETRHDLQKIRVGGRGPEE